MSADILDIKNNVAAQDIIVNLARCSAMVIDRAGYDSADIFWSFMRVKVKELEELIETADPMPFCGNDPDADSLPATDTAIALAEGIINDVLAEGGETIIYSREWNYRVQSFLNMIGSEHAQEASRPVEGAL